MMKVSSFTDVFSPADFAALAFYGACWALIEFLVRPRNGPSEATGELMAAWRHRWFEEAARRDNRIFDSNLVASLRAGVALYVTASLIALGGVIAMLGRADEVAMVAAELSAELSASTREWTVKLLLVVVGLALSFLHFVWSHRIFGYCSVMLGAIPNEPGSAEALSVARRGAKLSVLATRSFNKGLRAAYLALAALAWLIGPAALALATAATFWVLYRREFLSETRKALVEK